MGRSIFIAIVFVLAFSTFGFAQSFTGTYVLSAKGVTLTVTFQQNGNQVTGTMVGATGIVINMQGTAQFNMVSGQTSAQGMHGFFQAALQGNQLMITMMDAFPNGAPNYATTNRLILVKTAGAPQVPQATTPAAMPQMPTAQMPAAMPQMPAASGTSTKLTDPSWGFSVKVPAGWLSRKQGGGAIVGHNTIAGMILILPHIQSSKAAMKQEMSQGITEQNFQLNLVGAVTNFGHNGLVGDYSGSAQMQMVKAKGYGILLSGGKGGYVIAMAAPQVFSTQLLNAAKAIAKSISNGASSVAKVKTIPRGNPGEQALVQHFSGTWKSYSKYTERTVRLLPNGAYYDSYTASYGGGEAPGAMARDDNNAGRWTIRGNRQQGVITFTDNTGSSQIQYQVHTKDGHTYWSEYFFDGTLYGKQ